MITGQISGFLQTHNFLQLFGPDQVNRTYKCSNVRCGLVAGLVSLFIYNFTDVYQLSIGTLAGALVVAPIATCTNFLASRG